MKEPTTEDYQCFCDVINKWHINTVRDNREIAQIITDHVQRVVDRETEKLRKTITYWENDAKASTASSDYNGKSFEIAVKQLSLKEGQFSSFRKAIEAVLNNPDFKPSSSTGISMDELPYKMLVDRRKWAEMRTSLSECSGVVKLLARGMTEPMVNTVCEVLDRVSAASQIL